MSGCTGMVDSGSVAQFMDVTGASQEAAKFFLESSGGVVDAAVDQFFATGGEFSAAGAPEEETVEHDNVVPPGKQFLGITPSFASGTFLHEPKKQHLDNVLFFLVFCASITYKQQPGGVLAKHSME